MKKINIWTLVFWISILVLFAWLFAKQVGWINTPLFVQAIPFLSAFLVLFSMMKSGGRFLQRVDTISSKIDQLSGDVSDLKKEVHGIDKRLSVVETTIQHLDKRLNIIESKI